jgi:hypothetical protein
MDVLLSLRASIYRRTGSRLGVGVKTSLPNLTYPIHNLIISLTDLR